MYYCYICDTIFLYYFNKLIFLVQPYSYCSISTILFFWYNLINGNFGRVNILLIKKHIPMRKIINPLGREVFVSNFGHVKKWSIKKVLNLLWPWFVVACKTRSFEWCVQPCIHNLNPCFRWSKLAWKGKYICIVDGSSIDSFPWMKTSSSKHTGKFVGEDGDADTGTACNKTNDLRGGRWVG